MAKPKHYDHSIKKVSDLIPYVNNSRTHSEEQINQIASSIKEFGFTSPILIDEQREEDLEKHKETTNVSV